MTTIAVRDGLMAADSCETDENDDAAYGTTQNSCEKLFKVGPFVVGLQGDSTAGMVWLHWFRGEFAHYAGSFEESLAQASGGREVSDQQRQYARKMYEAEMQRLATPPRAPESLTERFMAEDADFTAVVLSPDGSLHTYDKWGVPIPVTSKFYAIGSGAKAALGALWTGVDAEVAVKAACHVDPYTREPVHVMRCS